MPMWRLRCLFSFFVTLAAVGCDTSEPMVPLPDGGPRPMDCDAGALAIDIETATPDGNDDPLAVPEDQARAGRLEASELPTDPNGLAVWSAGDFVLANGKVALIIEDVGDSDLYD